MKLTGFDLKRPQLDPFLIELERFRALFRVSKCPSCGEQEMKLVTYTQGPKGWSGKFFCLNCCTKGEVNGSGFTVEFSEKPAAQETGKATKKK